MLQKRLFFYMLVKDNKKVMVFGITATYTVTYFTSFINTANSTVWTLNLKSERLQSQMKHMQQNMYLCILPDNVLIGTFHYLCIHTFMYQLQVSTYYFLAHRHRITPVKHCHYLFYCHLHGWHLLLILFLKIVSFSYL